MEITSEIFQVGGSGFTSPEDGAVYLIKNRGAAALIDAGCGRSEQALLENIQAHGVEPEDIAFLLITHCHYDHAGGIRSLKERLGCQVVAHRLDSCFLEEGDNTVTAANWYGASIEPVTIDRKLNAPECEIELGGRVIRAIHVPGHSPGSVAYYIESDGKRVLFAQDVHGPLHPDLLSNSADYFSSLNSLLTLEADILCEGHLGVYKDKAAVKQFILSYLA